MSYKPDDWDEKKKRAVSEKGMLPPQTEFPVVIPSSLAWEMLKAQLYEAGADAMLESLKKNGEYLHNTGTMPYGYVLGRSLKLGDKGWLVFIPEEK